MAVTELGMDPEKFWRLTFYEWSLWMERIKILNDKDRRREDLAIELERGTMALLAHLHGNKNVTRQDFYKLSYDEVTTQVEVTAERMFPALVDRFKNIPIRKRG